jgi:prepilin-type N-terminal cleavage/methylation domain-containing protein
VNPHKIINSRPRRCGGFTLIECMAALMVSVLGIGALMSLNSHNFRMLRSTRESSAATLILQERAEQMRIATWRQVTDANYIRTTFFANDPKSAAPLDRLIEQVSVSKYPPASGESSLTVGKQAGQAAAVISTGPDFTSQQIARVDLQVQWTGRDSRVRTRQSSILVSNGGISRMNLPAFGATATGISAPSPTPTPAPVTGSPTPTPTPVVSPTPTPTPSGTNNGRGNVGGRPGKK